ncbi:hypothetical protein [Streptomyces sp. NPDC018711]|uniref:DUF7507 domain-containing protein n=1 Tax=Streptomyces sp. NPDC018711 TaxID=3365052 RepID=UPI0037BAB9A0
MSGGLLMAVLLVPPGAVAWAGGAGDGALRMTVTVAGRTDSAVRPPTVRAGTQVVKRYRLVNHGEAHLYGVRILDPGVPGGVVRCPRRTLGALREFECVARFPAQPGARLATARAEGDIPSLGRRINATARSGYDGVSGALALGERVVVGAGAPGTAGRSVHAAPAGTATVTYTVTNIGNRPVHAVRVGDTALGLGLGTVDCGGTAPVLSPGASVRCTATVRRPPGTHRSTGLATGTDRVPTYDAAGTLVPAPALTARSSAVFTIASPVVVRGVGGGGGGGGGGGAGGVVPGAGGVGGAGGARAAGAAGVAGAAGSAAAFGTPGALGVPGASAAAGTGTGTGTGAGTGAGTGTGGVPPAVRPTSPTSPKPSAPARVSPPRSVPDLSAAVPGTGTGTGGGTSTGGGTGTGTSATAARPPRAQAVRDDEGFVGRLRRRGREAKEFGVVMMLLLVLIPAAVAAALLGNRGK